MRAFPVSGVFVATIEGRPMTVGFAGNVTVAEQAGKDSIGFAGALNVFRTEIPVRTVVLGEIPAARPDSGNARVAWLVADTLRFQLEGGAAP